MGKKSLIIFIGIIAVALAIVLFLLSQKKTQTLITDKVNKVTKSMIVPGSCKILEEKYCLKAERTKQVINGKTYTYIGFNPPAGTPIFSTENGLLIKAVEGGNPFSGFLGRLEDDAHSRVYAYRGDIVFDDMLQKNVKAGDKIGVIGNSGVKNLGDYSLVVTSTKIPSSVTDEDMLKVLFHLK